MNCPKCGTQNLNNANYCRHCREQLTNSHEDQTRYSYQYSQTGDSKSTYSKPMTHEEYSNYSYQYSNTREYGITENKHLDQYNYSYNYSTDNVISGDEKYIANYVGKNYLFIKKSKFSLGTLIFGPIYFIYRKLYYYAFIWIIALVAIAYYIPEYLRLIYWCINAFLATKFTTIYLEKVEQRVDKIKHESLDLTTTELLEKCKKVGGTTKILTKLIPILIFLTILGVFCYGFYEAIQDATIEPEQTINSQIYNLSYTIPDGFIDNYISNETKSYYYEQNGNFCRLNVYINNYTYSYTNDIEYLKDKIYFETYPEITYKNINNATWAYMEYHPNELSTYYNYGHIYNNKGYMINYDILEDTTGECSLKYQEFINSIKFN